MNQLLRSILFVVALTSVNAKFDQLQLPFLEGYWESWNSVDSIQTIVGMDSNVITVAFVTFLENGGNSFNITGLDCSEQQLQQMISLAHDAGKKVKISVGGATYGLSGFLTSVEAAEGMAAAVAQFVNNNGLDGADFDIEDYPAANLQIALLQYVRQFLPNSLISYTPKAPASTTQPYAAVIQGAYENLTSISIMAYDAYAGYSYKTDIAGLEQMGVPGEKIVVGLMPGRDDIGGETTLQDIIIAAQYIVTNELAGMMLWDLNRDHEDLTGLGVDAATDAAFAILN